MILRMETKKQRLDVTCSTFSRAEKSSFFFTPKDFFVLGSRKKELGGGIWKRAVSIGSDSHASIAPSLSTSSSYSSFRFQSCTQLYSLAQPFIFPERKKKREIHSKGGKELVVTLEEVSRDFFPPFLGKSMD